MASRLRYEWVTLGASDNNRAQVTGKYGTAGTLAVSTSVTVPGSRPVAPNFGAGVLNGWARLTALDLPMIVSWGVDPTASDADGIRIQPNGVEVVPMQPGWVLSALEVT